MRRLPQSTAYTIKLKVYLASDHVTAATGKTVAITIQKGTGAFGNPAAGATNATELANGWYYVALGTGDTDTLGDLIIRGTAASCDDSEQIAQVVNANNGGLEALPDAQDAAAGGLYTRGTGAGQINQAANGQIDANVVVMAANTVTASAVADGAIDAGAIAADAITAAKIADGAIDAGALATGAITSAKFAAGAIDAAAIAADAIGASELAADAVTEIQNGLSTLDAAGVRSAVGLATANLDTQLGAIDDFLDTEIAAIKAKTDNLPSDPADASDLVASFSTVNATLAIIAAYIDTEVAAIKAKTDNLPASPAAVGSAMTLATDAVNAAALAADAVAEIQSGLSTLSAAGVRSAVGLASANLDTQFDALPTAAEVAAVVTSDHGAGSYVDSGAAPTAAEIDTQLSGTHGAGAWGSAGGGTGARTISVTVDDGVDPLEGAVVRLTKGIETAVGRSDAGGEFALNVDDGTWVVAASLAGYSYGGSTLVVDGDEALTISLTVVVITPAADPDQSTGALQTFDGQGAPQGNVEVSFRLITQPDGEGLSLSSDDFTLTSDEDGLLEAPFARLATYVGSRGATAGGGRQATFTVPDEASFLLPAILGAP